MYLTLKEVHLKLVLRITTACADTLGADPAASRLSQEADDLGNLFWFSRAVLDRRCLKLWLYNLRIYLIQHFGLNRSRVDLNAGLEHASKDLHDWQTANFTYGVHGCAVLPKLSSPTSCEPLQSRLGGSVSAYTCIALPSTNTADVDDAPGTPQVG